MKPPSSSKDPSAARRTGTRGANESDSPRADARNGDGDDASPATAARTRSAPRTSATRSSRSRGTEPLDDTGSRRRWVVYGCVGLLILAQVVVVSLALRRGSDWGVSQVPAAEQPGPRAGSSGDGFITKVSQSMQRLRGIERGEGDLPAASSPQDRPGPSPAAKAPAAVRNDPAPVAPVGPSVWDEEAPHGKVDRSKTAPPTKPATTTTTTSSTTTSSSTTTTTSPRASGVSIAMLATNAVDWTPAPQGNLAMTHPDYCRAFFGNGYVDSREIVRSESPIHLQSPKDTPETARARSATTTHVSCHHSPTVTAGFCAVTNLVVNPSRIRVSRGGERLEDVVGRADEDEFPQLTRGAFQAVFSRRDPASGEGDPRGGFSFPTDILNQWLHNVEREWMKSLEPAVADQASSVPTMAGQSTPGYVFHGCSEVVDEPTLFLTRYEYANLFHTSTDWYNVFQGLVLPQLQPDPEVAMHDGRVRHMLDLKPRVVFIDGHCQSPLDDAWNAMFSHVHYIKHLQERTCFRHAVFVPTGYMSPLNMAIVPRRDCPASPHIAAFRRFFLGSLLLNTNDDEPDAKAACSTPGSTLRILFIRREDYRAHPRHNGRIVHRIENEPDVTKALRSMASTLSKESTKNIRVEVEEGLFSQVKLRDQVEAVRRACAIVGAHGAGLTHVLFARPRTAVLEIQPPDFRRPHFHGYGYWAGAPVELMHVDSHRPSPFEIANAVKNLIRPWVMN